MKDKNLDFAEQNEKFILKFNKFFRIIITVPSYLGGVFWEKEQCFAGLWFFLLFYYNNRNTGIWQEKSVLQKTTHLDYRLFSI